MDNYYAIRNRTELQDIDGIIILIIFNSISLISLFCASLIAKCHLTINISKLLNVPLTCHIPVITDRKEHQRSHIAV